MSFTFEELQEFKAEALELFSKDISDKWTAVNRITVKIQYRNLNLKNEFMTEHDFHFIL